ncbi:MAG TPA: T9SS type A sorting domain-containing protein, partial [Candidatus Eisenbacteria bacterium]
PGGSQPAPRYGHGGIYDPIRDEVIFYGGYSSGCQYSVSVWALPMSGPLTWRNPSTTGWGGGVYQVACGYDAPTRRMVAFGGDYHLSCGQPQWNFDASANTMAGFNLDGNTWSPIWPNAAGPIHHESSAESAWDSTRRRMVAIRREAPLFNPPETPDGLVVAWVPTEARWDTLAPAGTGPLLARALLYDPVDDQLLVSSVNPSQGWFLLSFAATSSVPTDNAATRLGLRVHPNPTAGGSTIRFVLPTAGRARISIVDVRGRLIAVLDDREWSAGTHESRWERLGMDGTPVASGLYFVQVRSAGGTRAARLVVID